MAARVLEGRLRPRLAALLAMLAVGAASAGNQPPPWLTTKTPYQPQQRMATLEPVPTDFLPLHTQLVARHGARGMSGAKQELALLQLWRAARAEGALTPLGRRLGPDLERLLRVNARLGEGVEGVRRPGFGNLSRLGMAEHQGLARRLLQRMPALFDVSDMKRRGGRIELLSSGVDRAEDSAQVFIRALLADRPALAAWVHRPVLEGYPANAPKAQAAGTNRFLLYFHKLNAATDLVLDPADPAYLSYQRSQAYQAAADDAEVAAKLAAVQADPALRRTARHVLERLFSAEFVASLEQGERQFRNEGLLAGAARAKGQPAAAMTLGDGRTVLRSAVDVLMALSAAYEIAPGLRQELGGHDFRAYLPEDAAKLLAWANDAEDFYVKGPGIAEHGTVNHAMAGQLIDEMFAQVLKAAQATDTAGRDLASFRFSHAEILIPLASALELPGMHVQLPAVQLYRYDNNPWRGERVAPYSANLQWDAWRERKTGKIWLRMLHNERQTAFKPACDAARLRPGSFFYELTQLRACYGTAG
ncbi:histidine-type phosphatase [Paucibacter sp. APW11]|uniref:Multiple inositol polyphosphate phosphatase 1 n=1 Tax=Roseateles aquae TaxID=3077235 RepID=A0ABU3PEL1_9BURK|nr:histidine-type phosphatase [Paucibacter sp. APW11]MDT9001035.1 histidine-type phosphatase [Paucibacter sp. APW11]